jgi:hypothetical protein
MIVNHLLLFGREIMTVIMAGTEMAKITHYLMMVLV